VLLLREELLLERVELEREGRLLLERVELERDGRLLEERVELEREGLLLEERVELLLLGRELLERVEEERVLLLERVEEEPLGLRVCGARVEGRVCGVRVDGRVCVGRVVARVLVERVGELVRVVARVGDVFGVRVVVWRSVATGTLAEEPPVCVLLRALRGLVRPPRDAPP